MNARNLISPATALFAEHHVQRDLSGQGHCWKNVSPEDISADVTEEIFCWITEDDPAAGDEYTGSNGLHYRVAQ